MASSSPIWKYDVFLSFRGEDTRKNIVSHLHKELINRGIVTFKDDKRLELADSISGEISIAIQDSRFAIVILSKNFASSKWCLNELLMIMDLHLKEEIKVVPVFYGVDPSHVRHQNGNFTLDQYQGSEMASKVMNWRNALTRIASIAGKDSATCVDEVSMIEDIVDSISRQLLIMQPVDFSDFVGMNVHMERLNPLLSIESEKEVRMIGIWGMGGIGKTVIAKCLFDQFSRGFPSRCFVDNVKKIYKKHGVSYLQEKFISTTLCLPEKDTTFWSVELGPRVIKERLQHRKVFLVLDNVDDMKQVHVLAKEWSWFGPGSRIVITTRDKGLLNSCGVDILYEVKCLDTDDSLQIFNQLAFDRGIPPSEHYEKLSLRASWLAEGLPAATEAYGLFFRGMTSLNEWEEALRRFERAPYTKITEILKISYTSLQETDKSVFLHVACLFNGEPLRRATTLLDNGELQGPLGVRILADKSLIEITADGRIKMHYLVEQTAREIVRQESVQIRRQGRRVLWDPSEVYDFMARIVRNKPLECLALHMCEMPSALNLEKSNLNKFPYNLKFLKVYKHLDHIESMLQISSYNTIQLSNSLRLLHWDAFPLIEFPCLSYIGNLVDVSLRYSSLTSLWNPTNVLRNLRRLDLSGSKNLKLLPDLSTSVYLEELITQGCKRLKRIPESISNLTRLTKLDVSYCDELNSYCITIKELTGRSHQISLCFLGKEVAMEYIANLSIGGNIEIQMLGLDGNADHLCFSTEQQVLYEMTKREQQLTHNKPISRGLGSSMRQTFYGHEWMMNQDHQLPHTKPSFEFSMRTPQALPEFHGHNPMKKAEQKPQQLSEFHGFNSIDIIRFNYNSDGASFLCYGFSMFPCLKELNLINLNIRVIPDDICDLQFLEKLDLSGNDFETLPETMNKLPKLKHVSLCNCRKLKALPELVQLETVKLSGCISLLSLLKLSHAEQDLGRVQWIELWVDDCKNITSISDQLQHFVKLSYLDLSSNELTELPSSIKELSSLRTLCLNNCKKLQSIQGLPLCLKYLYAHGCEILKTVSLPLNHSIKHLDLSHCFCLKQDEHLMTQFLNEGENKEDSLRFAFFPGTKVPSYFNNIQTGKSRICPFPKMIGFDGCIVIACKRPFHIKFSPFSYDWDWGDEGYFYLFLKPDFFHGKEEKETVKSDHMVIIRGLKNISNKINKFGIHSDLQFSKEFESPPAKLNSCGFRLIWEEDLTHKNKTKKKKKSSRLSSLFKFEKLYNPSKFF